MGELFKSNNKRKNEARLRLKNSIRVKGTDEEYYKELLSTYQEFIDAKKCLSHEEIISDVQGNEII